jgi:hypothetical protein
MTSADAMFISNFDLDADGSIGFGDLVQLGNEWTGNAKAAKATPAPTADVAISMDAQVNNSMYLVNINVADVDGLNGVGVTLSYDPSAVELVGNSIAGLGIASITSEIEPGVIELNSFYREGEFDGTISVGFNAIGTSEFDIELVNASVTIDGVVGSVSDLSSVTLAAVPTVYALSQNFPNPFNPTTTIEYSIPEAGNVELVIYNMAGQKVRTLINESQSASFYKVVWDGRNSMGENVGAGLYIYKLISGDFSKMQKMTLIK